MSEKSIAMLSWEEYTIYSVTCFVLVCTGGLMSGLNIGLLSIDQMGLEMTLATGTDRDKAMARRVLPIVRKHHWLLATLLIINAGAMEALPIFLDRMVSEEIAICISVSLVLIFGEIVP